MSDEQQPAPPGALEKIATSVSVIMILALVAVLVVDGMTPNAEPSFATTIGVRRESSGVYRVPITVRNLGDDAARDVVVHAELAVGDSTVAETDVTVDWLPGKSSREVVALFNAEQPTSRQSEVRAQVRGFASP